MQFFNTPARYGIVAILLHWLMAALLIFLLVLGIYMTRLPISLLKLKLYGWHKEWGVLVFFIGLLRLLWRCLNRQPVLPNTIPAWQQFLAHSVHWSFYFFIFTIPLTGWFITSTAGLPVSFFGLFLVPDLLSPNEAHRLWYTQIHQWLSYALIAVLLLHTFAALKHHFWEKNDILRKIL